MLCLVQGCCGLKEGLGDFCWQWGEDRNGNCGAVDEGESFFSDSIDSMKGLCGKFKKKRRLTVVDGMASSFGKKCAICLKTDV